MKKLIEELSPLIEEAVIKSEQFRQISGGGSLILPRQALYIVNQLKRLANEAENASPSKG